MLISKEKVKLVSHMALLLPSLQLMDVMPHLHLEQLTCAATSAGMQEQVQLQEAILYPSGADFLY